MGASEHSPEFTAVLEEERSEEMTGVSSVALRILG